jgi:hypothetical protein
MLQTHLASQMAPKDLERLVHIMADERQELGGDQVGLEAGSSDDSGCDTDSDSGSDSMAVDHDCDDELDCEEYF